MRLLSWNINGIRTLPQYHPWNTLKSCEAILDELKADITCFQEMKTSRSALEHNVAVPESYDSFFSFPVTKGGYSGVAVYANSRTAVPLKAEEGLSGKLQPKMPLGPTERVSASYPSAHDVHLEPDLDGHMPSDLAALDTEGRALVVDFGLFVLINVYCPAETSEERLPYKMNFHRLLDARVRGLVAEGREVLVVGDINISAAPIDHCDGHLASNASVFYEHPPRAWFRDWLDPVQGLFVDAVRMFWPDRKGMYTCWNTKISARETNYGTRIDYILATRGLLPWIKHGDIQPALKGSDHCPTYIDLHDSITLPSGETRTLRETMHMDGPKRDPPRLAARLWDEYSGKQTKLSTFFGKKAETAITKTPATTAVTDVATVSETPPLPGSAITGDDSATPSSSLTSTNSEKPSATTPSQKRKKPEDPPLASTSQKRKQSANASSSSSAKNKKLKAGQSKLSSFFAKPPTTSSPPIDLTLDDVDTATQVDADHRFALQLSASQEHVLSPSIPSSSTQSPGESRVAWSQLMAPIQPPRCTGHNEPTKELTVNKPGPNKGKNFFICSRPVGPGYDKGRAERLREEVDPQYRCDFFRWSSEVKREALHRSSKTPASQGP
ncbi:hypothetical protein PLICRDRAFT_176924 [Plicaturopsis crispa FD-325 SS-3]|nr:hypothetical protein PLICRDRAFT_176924 [Plicaturopsis crispa FD-325 SS-3]